MKHALYITSDFMLCKALYLSRFLDSLRIWHLAREPDDRPLGVAIVFANGAARLLKLETTKKPPSHSFSFKVRAKRERSTRKKERDTLLRELRVSLHDHYNLSNGALLLIYMCSELSGDHYRAKSRSLLGRLFITDPSSECKVIVPDVCKASFHTNTLFFLKEEGN